MSVKVLNGLDLNNKNITGLADGSAATDAVTKQQLDNAITGLSWKPNVRVATTATGTLATAFANGQTIDGVTLVTGDRILLKNQASGQENGIYVVAASGAPTRAADADTAAEIKNAIVRVSEGTVNADTMYQMVTDGAITLNTTPLVWTVFTGGGGTYTADGQGIEVSTNQFSLELDGSSLSKSATGVKVANAFVTALAGAGLVEASQVLAVGAGTGIVVNANDVAIDPAVVVRKFAANCVVTTNPQTFTDNLGTLDKQITVVEVATGKIVLAEVTEASTNTFTVDFGGAPTAGQYRVIAQA